MSRTDSRAAIALQTVQETDEDAKSSEDAGSSPKSPVLLPVQTESTIPPPSTSTTDMKQIQKNSNEVQQADRPPSTTNPVSSIPITSAKPKSAVNTEVHPPASVALSETARLWHLASRGEWGALESALKNASQAAATYKNEVLLDTAYL